MKAIRQKHRLFLRGLALAAAIGMCGGHWVILQSVAWTTMIVRYSQRATLQTAIEETFDGRHPCAMCRMIEAARQAPRQSQQEFRTTVVPDDNGLFATTLVVDSDPPGAQAFAAAAPAHPERSDPPPVPPPRSRATAIPDRMSG